MVLWRSQHLVRPWIKGRRLKNNHSWTLWVSIPTNTYYYFYVTKVTEFCESTSIHGLKYITEPGSHWAERCFWIVLVFISILLQIQFVLPILEKYKNTKIITTVDTTNYPISNIDFPAVTVCSNIRVANSQFKSTMTHSKLPWKNLSEEDQDKGVGQIVTNLVNFQNDPDLLYSTTQSRDVMHNYSDSITPLMAMVITKKIFLFIKIMLFRSALLAPGCFSSANGRARG